MVNLKAKEYAHGTQPEPYRPSHCLDGADEARLRFDLPSSGTLEVRVYFNLHRHVFSVKALEGDHKGKVIAHTPLLVINNVTPFVSEAGRQRVLAERCKNVHAYLQGSIDLAHLHDPSLIEINDVPHKKISYDPYKGPSFIYVADGCSEFKSAEKLLLTSHDRGIWEPLNCSQ